MSKGFKNPDSQTLEELFLKIQNYSKEWIEQEKCLELIIKYQNGERYEHIYQ